MEGGPQGPPQNHQGLGPPRNPPAGSPALPLPQPPVGPGFPAYRGIMPPFVSLHLLPCFTVSYLLLISYPSTISYILPFCHLLSPTHLLLFATNHPLPLPTRLLLVSYYLFLISCLLSISPPTGNTFTSTDKPARSA